MKTEQKNVSFVDIGRETSKLLMSSSGLAALYQRPAGTGEGREEALRKALRDFLPARFGVDKCRIYDCFGELSSEFDIVIYSKDHSLSPLVVKDMRFVPIEATHMVIEVKSSLGEDTFEKFKQDLEDLNRLKRFYCRHFPFFPSLDENQLKQLQEGINPFEGLPEIGRISSAILAFDGPGNETIAKYLGNFHHESLLYICIPDKSFITKWFNPPGYYFADLHNDSFGGFLWSLGGLLADNRRHIFFTPDFRRYTNRFNNEIDKFPGSRLIWKDQNGSEPAAS